MSDKILENIADTLDKTDESEKLPEQLPIIIFIE